MRSFWTYAFAWLAACGAFGGVAQASDAVKPFLETHWRQDSPFNDFAPVVVEDPEDDDTYRGRAPSGCVATALAQIMRAWEWPYCANEVRTSKHSVSQGSVMDKGTDIYLRVDTRSPFRWESMGPTGAGDRLGTARVLLWIDSLVGMMFARTGSGADIDDFRRASEAWFEPYENVPRYATDFAEKVVAEIRKGYPVAMMIPGHQVVADGWKYENGIDYVHLNHGWGGKDDGWHPLQGDGMLIQAAQLIRPLRTVQIETLPAECEDTVTLRWHAPRFYSQEINGFVLTERVDGAETRTFEASSTSRSFTIAGLEAGHCYAYTVRPLMEKAVESMPVETRSVPSARPRPRLSAVSSVTLPCAGGSFEVVGENVATLAAYSSHLSVLSDSDCSVVKGESGRWTVSLSPRAVANRQNIILTLVAEGVSGETVIQDVAVHFGDLDRVVVDLSSFRIVSFGFEEENLVFETEPARSELDAAGYSVFLYGSSSLAPAVWEATHKPAHRFFKALVERNQ